MSQSTKKPANKTGAIALILSILYVFYLMYHFMGVSGDAETNAEQLGTALAITIVMPHIIATILAVIFNALGYFLHKKGFMLTGAILYTVAIVLMPIYFMFLTLQMILAYVSYSKMKPIKSEDTEKN